MVSGSREEPKSGPRQLVAVIRAAEKLFCVGYRFEIKAAIRIGEFVKLYRMLETPEAVIAIDAPEDDARSCESSRRFAGEIRA